MSGPLETALRAGREAGRKLLVPYVTGGLDMSGQSGDEWTRVVQAVAGAGADAIEIGVPFSDPVMDGPTIQDASERALRAGTTPGTVLDQLRGLEVGVPLAVMTYYNIVFRMGHRRFASSLVDSGVVAAILPDLPLEESGPWCEAADEAGVETVMLAAPTASDERLERVCERARGFVYGVGLLGVTGERDALSASAMVIAKRLKASTDKPVLIGVGVSNAEQAREICTVADGVVVGAALIRRLLEGGGAEGAAEFVAELRAGLSLG